MERLIEHRDLLLERLELLREYEIKTLSNSICGISNKKDMDTMSYKLLVNHAKIEADVYDIPELNDVSEFELEFDATEALASIEFSSGNSLN